MELSAFGERLARLRLAKGVSARKMSEDIGRNANYINKVENNKMFPSMPVFFDICEYLKISPSEFFNKDNADPIKSNEFFIKYHRLDHKGRENIEGIVDQMIR